MRKGYKQSILKSFAQYTREFLEILVCVYMVLVIVVMPFYFTDGYTYIGTNKYEFFYNISVRVGMFFLPVLGIYLMLLLASFIRDGRRKKSCSKHGKGHDRKNVQVPAQEISGKLLLQKMKDSLSVTDWFVLFYGVAVILSYLFSDYKEMTGYGSAWKGANSWFMGFVSQITFVIIYFAVSRFFKMHKWLLAAWIPVSFVVFLLGYCNRFGVYPIKMENAQSAFISTIGNINWFCGYIVTVFFGVLYYWWSGAEKKKWMKYFLDIYVLAGFGILIVQGSNSGIMALMAMCVTFYLLSVKQGEKMQQFWKMMLLLAVACTVTLILRHVFPGRFNFVDTLVDILTYTVLPVLLLIVTVILYVGLEKMNKKGKYPEKVFAVAGKVGMIAVGALLGLFVLCIVVNTLIPGSLGPLSQLSVFTFNETWGSHRGATYMAGIRSWLDQDFAGKLFGVGPDCMAMYIHMGNTNQELADMVHRIWGTHTMLTNAHCEWLTVLVNIGLVGLVGYAGMIISAVTRFLKKGKANIIAGACGVCVLAYTVNNVVSFQQAMATTTMFVILGIGEAAFRNAAVFPAEKNAG